jgi:hypothetical protein
LQPLRKGADVLRKGLKGAEGQGEREKETPQKTTKK